MSSNHESIQIVAEDLAFLSKWGPNINDADIRRGSAVLRRLLVEDAYGNAWRSAGFPKQPELSAIDITEFINDGPIQNVRIALAAGCEFRGIQIAGIVMKIGAQAAAPAFTSIHSGGYPGERMFSMSEYVDSPSGFIDGVAFSRRDVIKYIANVKGGVHLSQGQRKKEQLLIEKLGKIDRRIRVHTTDGLLVELVAIAQSLGRAPDTMQFIAKAAELQKH